MIAAIVPAAGGSTRMGAPKALLRVRDTTFLGAILEATKALGLSPRILVVGEGDDKILRAHVLEDVTTLRNAMPDSGPIGSIRVGIRHLLNHPVDGALVWHVDRPHVRLATVATLMDRYRQGGCAIVVPAHGGRRGHPVLFGRAVFDELLTVPDALGARGVVRADPLRVAAEPVDDPAVLESIDTPEEYEELLRRINLGRG